MGVLAIVEQLLRKERVNLWPSTITQLPTPVNSGRLISNSKGALAHPNSWLTEKSSVSRLLSFCRRRKSAMILKRPRETILCSPTFHMGTHVAPSAPISFVPPCGNDPRLPAPLSAWPVPGSGELRSHVLVPQGFPEMAGKPWTDLLRPARIGSQLAADRIPSLPPGQPVESSGARRFACSCGQAPGSGAPSGANRSAG